MTTTQWLITLAVTLVAGGAMGSVIGIIATNRRNRIQPITAHKELIPFMNKQVAGSASNAEVLIKVDGKEEAYRNLTLGRVTVTNTGNKDYEKFEFEITLSGLNMATYIQTESPDRSHVITTEPQINLNTLDNEIDVALRPFNRGNSYSICMFIIPSTEPVEIHLSTKHPVQFLDLDEYRDVATSMIWELLENTRLAGVPLGIPVKGFRKLLIR